MKHTIKLFLIFLLIIGCKEPQTSDDIKTCVKNKRNKIIGNTEKFYIYQSYNNFENMLDNKGFIEKLSKQTHIDLLKELALNNSKMLELKEKMKNEMRGFDFLREPAIAKIQVACIKDYLENFDLDEHKRALYDKNNLDEDKIALYKKNFDTVLINKDVAKNIQFVVNTPEALFRELHFRIPILAIIYFKLLDIDGSGELKK